MSLTTLKYKLIVVDNFSATLNTFFCYKTFYLITKIYNNAAFIVIYW